MRVRESDSEVISEIGRQAPVRAVVEAVAAVADREPLALPPLYGSVDPDALDTLTTSPESVRVEFDYVGCTVSVSDGQVTVVPP